MSLPLSCYADRLKPLPNEDAGCSNTGLRRRQEAPVELEGIRHTCHVALSPCALGRRHPHSRNVPDESR